MSTGMVEMGDLERLIADFTGGGETTESGPQNPTQQEEGDGSSQGSAG